MTIQVVKIQSNAAQTQAGFFFKKFRKTNFIYAPIYFLTISSAGK